MAAVIGAHQPELLSQWTLILLGPDEVTLTEAMDQDNRSAMGLAVFMHGELQTTAPGKPVDGHGSSSRTETLDRPWCAARFPRRRQAINARVGRPRQRSTISAHYIVSAIEGRISAYGRLSKSSTSRKFWRGLSRVQSSSFRAGVKETRSVPFSMNVGCGIIGVASPAGSQRCPCECQPTVEEGTRPVRTLWHGDWRGSPSPVSFTENGTDPILFASVGNEADRVESA
jgi:hypothetical protein